MRKRVHIRSKCSTCYYRKPPSEFRDLGAQKPLPARKHCMRRMQRGKRLYGAIYPPLRSAALSNSQFEWLKGNDHEGYCAMLVRGLDETKVVLSEYASWLRAQIVGMRQETNSGTGWRKD